MRIAEFMGGRHGANLRRFASSCADVSFYLSRWACRRAAYSAAGVAAGADGCGCPCATTAPVAAKSRTAANAARRVIFSIFFSTQTLSIRIRSLTAFGISGAPGKTFAGGRSSQRKMRSDFPQMQPAGARGSGSCHAGY